MESEWYLKKYLHINAEINRLRRKKHLTQKKLYQQTLTTHLEYNALGIRTQAPKIEYIVSDNIEACELIERRIERWKIRKRYFIEYLNQLTSIECNSLKDGSYTVELYEKTIEEIKEIEVAIELRFGVDPDEEHIELDGDLINDIAIMSEVFC